MLYWFSAVQQCKSAIIIQMSPSSWASLPFHQTTSLGHHRAPGWAPCYIATSHWLSALHMAVYICWWCFLHLSYSLLPLLCPQVFIHLFGYIRSQLWHVGSSPCHIYSQGKCCSAVMLRAVWVKVLAWRIDVAMVTCADSMFMVQNFPLMKKICLGPLMSKH